MSAARLGQMIVLVLMFPPSLRSAPMQAKPWGVLRQTHRPSTQSREWLRLRGGSVQAAAGVTSEGSSEKFPPGWMGILTVDVGTKHTVASVRRHPNATGG